MYYGNYPLDEKAIMYRQPFSYNDDYHKLVSKK